MAKRSPNNGNSLTVLNTRYFYASQKAETENVTLNCDRPLDGQTYTYFTNLFDFTKYKKEDRETYRSEYMKNLRKGVKNNQRKELEIICRVLLTQLEADD